MADVCSHRCRRLFGHLLRPAEVALGYILILAAALAARPAFWAIGKLSCIYSL